MSAWAGVRTQGQDPLKKPHADDPCGDPTMESNVWVPVKGRVVEIVDGDTVVMSFQGQHRQVHLIGIQTPALNRPFGRAAQQLLARVVKNRDVDVWISPSDWWHKRSPPKQITGVVYLQEQNNLDVNLELIRAGLARYKSPPPYKMSTYTACQYVNAEEQARTAKRGLWGEEKR